MAPAGVGVEGVEMLPLSTARWPMLVDLFGTRGDPATCWCQWFRRESAGFRASTPVELRAALEREAGAPVPSGVLAVKDSRAIGWVAASPRVGHDRLTRGPGLRAVSGADIDDPAVWSVTCFVVRVGHRRQGLSHHLLHAAVDLARDHGARVVEGYPIELAAGRRRSSAELYHGVASVFGAAGFLEVGRTSLTRPVVRLTL